MANRSWLGAFLCLFATLAIGSQAPAIPRTSAGNALSAWLEAMNGGDRAPIETFSKVHAPWLTEERLLGIRTRTGGYDLLTIEGSGALWVTFQAKERMTGMGVYGRLVVRPNDLAHVDLLDFIPADTRSTEIVVDERERALVINNTIRLLKEFYVFPDAVDKTASALLARQKRRGYANITDGEIFAVRLSDDLAALSGDRHIQVDYFPKGLTVAPIGPRPTPNPRTVAARNCGFTKAEHLQPNIGYLKIDFLDEPELCAATASAAMTFLADSDALILDLRNNAGGSPPMVAFLASYLFDAPTHFDDIYDRGANSTESRWTTLDVPGKKFVGKPVYVLTAARTFSAGEELAFGLKNLRRATLIGENTGGGAHTVAPHRIDNHFAIRVPFGRMMDPVTRTDWEGVGVEPDIKIAAGDAFEQALTSARGQAVAAPPTR